MDRRAVLASENKVRIVIALAPRHPFLELARAVTLEHRDGSLRNCHSPRSTGFRLSFVDLVARSYVSPANAHDAFVQIEVGPPESKEFRAP